MKLSHIAETLPQPAPLAMNNAVKERMAKGQKIYNYTIGDFDPEIFPIPTLLEEAVVNAYRNKYTNYPAAEGNADLRKVLSTYIRQFQNLDYQPSDILVASGGRPVIYAAFQTIVDPGEKVIFPVPCWNIHYYTQLSGGTPCVIETKLENNFMLTADEIKPHLQGAVLLALCSPQNPTGTCYTEEQIKAICNLVVEENNRRGPGEKKLYILYDQIYNLLVYDGQKHIDPVSVCAEMKAYTVYMDAISKNFAATGVRVGWGYGPESLINKMKTILSHVGAWAPMPEQNAVTKFLSDHRAIEDYLTVFRKKIGQRLNKIYNGILDLKQEGLPIDAILPQASIYLTIKISIPGDVFSLLLDKAGVALLPFTAFGAQNCPGWFRLSIGTCRMEDIEPVLKKIRQVLIAYCAMAH